MKTLREAFDYPFSQLDPLSAHVDPPAIAIYETLLVKGVDGRAHDGLGRVDEVSADGLRWIIKLRQGTEFHSGAPVTAPAVLDSLNALRWYYGADRQLWYWDAVSEVRAVDDETLVFTLHHPYPRLTTLLWGTHTAVFNRDLQLSAPDAFGESLADGTGPFRLVEKAAERIIVERNPRYGGPRVPGMAAGTELLDRIEWFAMPDPAERLAALVEGRVDVAHGIDADGLRKLSDGFSVYRAPQASNMYLGLNFDRMDLGFDDVRMRRLLSEYIDRVALVEIGLGGLGSPTAGPLPARSEFYSASVEAQPRLSRVEARQQLAGLGWLEGTDGILTRSGTRLSFECVVQDDHYFRRVAAALEGQMGMLGIELMVRYVTPFAPFYQACGDGPAAFLSKWLWQDAMEAVTGFASSSNAGFINWSNSRCPSVDRALEAWRRAARDGELSGAAERFQSAFLEELPYIPLLTPDDTWVWSNRVEGWCPSTSTLYPFYQGVTVT